MARPFVNPYNFIPLSVSSKKRKIERTRTKEVCESLLTGKIHYSVETVTPLFIPNTSNDKLFGVKANHQDENEYHKSYDFFSYNDLSKREAGEEQPYYAPVIPGSEIRGAIRSIYEAITDSCLSTLDEDHIFSRRTPERYKPGLLVRNQNGKYILKEAEDYICRNSDDFSVYFPDNLSNIKDGSPVSYIFSDLNSNRWKKAKKIVDIVSDKKAPIGYIIKGQKGPVLPKPEKRAKCANCPQKTKEKCAAKKGEACYLLMKHNAHVFVEKSQRGRDLPKPRQITEQEINIIDNVLEIYKKNSGGAYEEYGNTWKAFKTGGQDAFPVYYSILSAVDGEERILLSPACITREVYQNTFESVLGRHYLPCEELDHLCPACRLFGTVNKGLSRASSIRFSDLKAEYIKNNEEYYSELLTLDELGQPKPSSMEFYLKKPEVTLKQGEKLIAWTFDYYITVDGDGRPGIYFYTPDIAGRKFYWHSKKAAERQKTLREAYEKEEEWSKENPDQDKYITKRNKTIRPVRSGITFYGDLYFNQITKTQLEQLISVLNISKSETYGIKIGAAKPLGLGSVKLKVQQVDYREVSTNKDQLVYQVKHYDFQNIDISGWCDKQLLKAFEFRAVVEEQYEVAYPFVNSVEDEGFKWFGNNRKAFAYKRATRSNGEKVLDYSRLDLDKTALGPGSTLQIPYRNYMVALRPELADSGFIKVSDPPTNFKENKEYEGKVIGYKPGGKFAIVRLNDGSTTSFWDKSHKYENQSVILNYKGKDAKGYDQWQPMN